MKVSQMRHAAAVTAAGLALLGLALLVGVSAVAAQQGPPRIWDIPFGTHVSALPTKEFVEPACGTNGGPPGLMIGGFDQFAKCPEKEDGLREIWFIYDDTLEYVALARRDAALIGRYRATAILGQPIILSFLIDRAGRIQGYRIFTDPRAETALRLEAYIVATHFKARFGLGWECVDLARVDGEKPIEGVFVKQLCDMDAGGRHMTVESRYYHKPGQRSGIAAASRSQLNEFESWARLEVRQVAPPPEADGAGARLVPDASTAPLDHRAAFLAGLTSDCPGCDLADCDFRRRDLTGADLSGAKLEGAVFHRAILRRANLSGANLFGANLNRADLTLASLQKANLGQSMLFEASAGRADFSDADLNHALMGKAAFTLAKLKGANLDVADLSEARMNEADLTGATLNVANLQLAVLSRANLRQATAEGAIFGGAILRGADLSEAVLRNADFIRADLSEANLSGADFRGTRLQSANLLNASRAGTIFTGALMPDNSVGR